MALSPQTVAGQIHLSLALNLGTGMSKFAKAIRKVVAAKICFLRGSPGADADAFRRHLLRLCLARGTKLVAKKALLLTLPNGDWRRRDRIEIYLPEAIEVDRHRITSIVADSLAVLLAGCNMTVYPRHRWTKADRALDEVCLLEGIHGLGSMAWPVWSEEFKRQPAAAPAVPNADPLAVPQPGGEAVEILRDAAYIGESSAFCAEQAQQENDQHRRVAGEWLASKPFTSCVICRLAIEPLQRLQTKQLTLGGEGAESEQQAHQARSLLADSSPQRTFIVVECAMGRVEEKFHRDVEILMDNNIMWQPIIPPADRTLKYRGLAFRMLSSEDCLVEWTLGAMHRRFPFRWFTLLAEPTPANLALLLASPCLFDAWTASFVETYQHEEGGLLGPVAMAALRLIATMSKVDIAAIEALHAAIRRLVYTKGVQTHAETLEELSAEFVCQRARRLGTAWLVTEHDTGNGCDEKSGDQSVHRWGGSWRAFVRQKSLGTVGRPDTSALSREYRQLRPEQLKALALQGDAARRSKQAGAKGASSFGPKARETRRTQQRVQRQAAVQHATSAARHNAALPIGDRCERAVELALRQGADNLPLAVSRASAIVRHDRTHEGLLQRQREQDLASWKSSHGLEVVRRFLHAHPSLQPYNTVLSGVPCPNGMHGMRYSHPTSGVALVASTISAKAHQSNLNKAMLLDWLSKHSPIMHSACAPIQPKKRSKKTPSCADIGICICCPERRSLPAIRTSFYKQMKAAFPKRLRSELSSKFVVAKVHGHLPAAADAWEEAARMEQDLPASVTDTVLWWHIGHQNFSPYEAVFRVLNFDAEHHLGGARLIELKVTGRSTYLRERARAQTSLRHTKT